MKLKKFFNSQKVAPYVFVLPFILSFAVFWIYPLFSTVKMSFEKILPSKTTFVALANYEKLLNDRIFHIAIGNSFWYMVWTIIILIPLPMIFACIMDSNLVKAKGLWKALLYLPALSSVVVSGMLFRLMFSELPTSQMNVFLQWLGQLPIKWLKQESTARFALVLLATWRWTGVNMLYYIAGLKNIDKAYYEAAEIDGAGAFQRFRYITLPLLKPTNIYVLTISIYAGLSMFLESFMLWAGNSSPRNIGLTIVGYLYRRGIEKNELGYASAVGLVLLVIALIINIIQLILNGSFKKEEA
ncbi:alpha-arabinosides ABC transport system, permease protein 1 [Lachnospiraceae bacterium KM106-2]|nr:alpha-arabinosides ABC transport system, permease protein 1 [Lachnospiraceae bacterium KM106-2]